MAAESFGEWPAWVIHCERETVVDIYASAYSRFMIIFLLDWTANIPTLMMMRIIYLFQVCAVLFSNRQHAWIDKERIRRNYYNKGLITINHSQNFFLFPKVSGTFAFQYISPFLPLSRNSSKFSFVIIFDCVVSMFQSFTFDGHFNLGKEAYITQS